jgi:hypothetical protein
MNAHTTVLLAVLIIGGTFDYVRLDP